MLEELKKLFGELMGDTGGGEVPAKAAVPSQPGATGDFSKPVVSGLYGDITMPEPNSDSMPKRLGEAVSGSIDSIGESFVPVRNIIDRARDVIGGGSDASFEDLKAGLTGTESKANWDVNPGTGSQKAYADGMIAKQEAIKAAVYKQPSITNILDTAAAIDPAVIKGLTPEDDAEAKKAGDIAAELLLNDKETDPKTVMESAAGFLGGLFEDKAIQQALIYYTGSRLMGYSGSGSGIAAGSVLLQGWANQDKKDLLTQTATAKAADEKSANDALDMSKTVTMWDPKAKQAVSGYMSKSGRFQSSAGGDIVNAKDYGLESYDKARHKTFDGIDLENIDYINGASKDVLANVSNNSEIYSPAQQQAAQALFADGSAIQESYKIATRSARANGVDTSTPDYRTALGNSVRKYMMSSIKNPTDKFSGSITAGMADAIRADQLKADLTEEGGVPKFVFGKATWDADGIETMVKGYELPNAAVSKLMKQVDNINSGLVKVATDGKHSAEKIRTLITPTKTLQKLSKIFKDTVMKNPEARAHWTKVGDKSNTNAMNAWLASRHTDTDHKYLGINNPSVNAKFHTLYNKKFKE